MHMYLPKYVYCLTDPWEKDSSVTEVASPSLLSVRSADKRIACDEEFSDSEDEGEGGRKNVANFKKSKRVKAEDDKEEEEKKGRCKTGTSSMSDCSQEPVLYAGLRNVRDE